MHVARASSYSAILRAWVKCVWKVERWVDKGGWLSREEVVETRLQMVARRFGSVLGGRHRVSAFLVLLIPHNTCADAKYTIVHGMDGATRWCQVVLVHGGVDETTKWDGWRFGSVLGGRHRVSAFLISLVPHNTYADAKYTIVHGMDGATRW